MNSSTCFSIFFLCLVFGGIFVIGYMTSPAATVGIQVFHDRRPVDNLEVRIYLPGYANSGAPNKLTTTDGTGLATMTVNYPDLWNGGSILYDFGFNGTIYSFSGPMGQIIEVSV